MVTSDEIKTELRTLSEYVTETLPKLTTEKLMERYFLDVGVSIGLLEGDYVLTPGNKIFERLRKRATRVYQVSLNDLLEKQDHPLILILQKLNLKLVLDQYKVVKNVLITRKEFMDSTKLQPNLKLQKYQVGFLVGF